MNRLLNHYGEKAKTRFISPCIYFEKLISYHIIKYYQICRNSLYDQEYGNNNIEAKKWTSPTESKPVFVRIKVVVKIINLGVI